MSISLNKSNEAYKLLESYKGNNSYIISLKNNVFAYKSHSLNDFEVEYILKNHNFQPILINKLVKVSKWFAAKKQEEWNLDFLPYKLKIGYYLGETNTFYHMFVQYRKSQTSMIPIFIPKKALLTNIFVEDWENKHIDFQKYNTMSGLTLKPHQERAIKFLTTRKKGVLALQMGFGKSISAIVSALENEYRKILVVCPASVKSTWKRELKYFVHEDEITIVEGSKWKENKFTIINYDILDNFYEVPTEIVKRRVKDVDENGKIKYNWVEKEVVSRKNEIIKDAMENSQLFQSQFDCIIIDEVHRLSNKTSGRYKIISDLIQRSKPQGIFELTGTMITNNPMNLYNILKLIDADVTKDWVHYAITYCDGKQIFVKGERDKYTNVFLKKHNKTSWYDLTPLEKDELNTYLDNNCRKIWLTNGASNLDELQESIKHIYYRETKNDSVTVKKETHLLNYSLSLNEQMQYDNTWDDYINQQEEKDLDTLLSNKKLIETSVLRQTVANMMIPHTIKKVNEILNTTKDKVIIACSFDNELYSLQEEFKDICVIYNGKLNRKQKDAAEEKFKNDDNIRVFIGNTIAAGVGLTLISANHLIFNSVSFLPSDNQQMEYRIIRIGQEKDCHIYYQSFQNTYMDRMYEILNVKQEIIDTVIVDENDK